MIPPEILNRKGAKSRAEVPPNVLDMLTQGFIPTVNLVEWLAVNQEELLHNIFKPFPYLQFSSLALKGLTINKVNEKVGEYLVENCNDKQWEEIFGYLSIHISDFARAYACYMVAKVPRFSFKEKLEKLIPLINDAHFGVREVAWMALRPFLAIDLKNNLSHLEPLALAKEEGSRRFAIEISRPRGVWCKHIEELKQAPYLALAILEPLKDDPSRYVQNSVANWLNDAYKTAPDFVEELTAQWGLVSNSKATQYIVKRALRSKRESNI